MERGLASQPASQPPGRLICTVRVFYRSGDLLGVSWIVQVLLSPRIIVPDLKHSAGLVYEGSFAKLILRFIDVDTYEVSGSTCRVLDWF